MSKHNDQENAAPDTGLINRTPPTKRELVERALSDGMTDPARIAEWASNYGNYHVTLTTEEVIRLIAELKSESARQKGASPHGRREK